MRLKKKGFTLLELVTVLSISAILLTISTRWYIVNVTQAGNNNNKIIDLQTGVSTSMEMIKNTLRKSTQVHLVGKNVYDPDMSLADMTLRLDPAYAYIGLYKDPITNQKILANIIYSSKENKFNAIPIISSDKQDELRKNVVSYTMDFYRGDSNYKKKMGEKIVNISVKGVARDLNHLNQPINPEDDKEFELSEDIFLPNTNQILVSRFFTGDLDKITAIAYDQGRIIAEREVSKGEMTFVFAIDDSGSMNLTLSGNQAFGAARTRKQISSASIMTFLRSLDKLGREKNVEMNAYLYIFSNGTMIDNPILSSDGKFLWDLKKLENHPTHSYGPLTLGDESPADAVDTIISTHLNTKCRFTQAASGGTSTGKAILQGLQILNQVKNVRPTHKRFFILMTDGDPRNHYFGYSNTDGQKIFITNVDEYKSTYNHGQVYIHEYGTDTDAMRYVEAVTMPISKNNNSDTFDKAYLIGFSGRARDKEMLGISDISEVPPAKSIRAHLAQDNKSRKVYAFDADSEAALNTIFEGITQDIGNVMGVFDGPNKLR